MEKKEIGGKPKMEKAKSKMQKKKKLGGKRQNHELDEQNKEIEYKKKGKKNRGEKKIGTTSLNVSICGLFGSYCSTPSQV